MVAWCVGWGGLLALVVFRRGSLGWFPVVEGLAVALMCCSGLRAWWSAQSRLAALLSSLVARRWVGLRTLWWFRLKTCLLVGWWGPDALAVCRAHRGLPVGFLLLRCSV